MSFDVDEHDFSTRVLERSHELPVVVDFWASWCGPCRALTPALERAVSARQGQVELAKVDVDCNQRLSQTFGVQGIPAVKAFRQAAVVEEFSGAIAPAAVEEFFDRVVPSASELDAAEALRTGDEQALRRALDSDPRNTAVATSLARILLARADDEEALRVLKPFEQDFLGAGLIARSRLSLAGAELGPAFSAWDAGDHAQALELLHNAFAGAQDPGRRDLVRQAMVGVFTELGPQDPLAREHRRRLSAVLH